MGEDMLRLLETRRSTKAADMVGPGPAAAALERILRIGMRVPDHGKLVPWRFIVLEGEGRAAFADQVAGFYADDNPGCAPSMIEDERQRPQRGSVTVAVVFSPKPHKAIPEMEQLLSTGAVCQNMLIAADAMGFAGQWLTRWIAFDARVKDLLGLSEAETIAGFLFFGSKAGPSDERPRPEYSQVVSYFQG